jgi:TP901 family phage tail tape measure protein
MNNKLSLLVNFVGVDRMSAGLRSIVGLGRSGSQSLRGLNGEARRLQREMRDVSRELQHSTGNVSELVERERQLEKALAGVNRQIDRQKRLSAIDADRQAMRNHGEDLQRRGAGNVMGGVSLAAPLILATKAAAEFTSGLVDVQQKAELSDQATDSLANKIVLLADRARQMPEDMRAGLDALLGKGMDVDPATVMLGPIGKLATAYKVEIPDAANAGYAAMMNLKIPANQVATVFDIMASAGKDGSFEIADMARQFPSLTAQMQALGEVGPRAAADLSAALQVAMHTAGNADEAGNNIQNLLSKINAPGTITAFKKNFGIDLPAAMKKLEKQGYSSMEAIAMLTTRATKGDTKKLGFAFEDQQARMGLLAIIQNLKEYRDIRESAMKAGGLVDKQFDQRVARDATVQWRAFLGSASSLAIVLGTTLLPVATQTLGYLHDAAAAVSHWAQQNPALAATLMKVAAGLITAKIGIGALQFAFGGFLGPAANLIAFFRKVEGISKFTQMLGLLRGGVGTTATIMVRAFGVMRIAAMFLARGVMQAGLLMLANPIVLAITAIVLALAGAGYLIYRNWDRIKAAFTGGIAWVKGALAAVPAWLSGIGKMMMQGLLLALDPMALASRLLSIAKSGITAFKNFFGIKSPSRLFMEMGGHLTSGLTLGIDRGGAGPKRAVSAMMAGISLAAAVPIVATAPALAAANPGPVSPVATVLMAARSLPAPSSPVRPTIGARPERSADVAASAPLAAPRPSSPATRAPIAQLAEAQTAPLPRASLTALVVALTRTAAARRAPDAARAPLARAGHFSALPAVLAATQRPVAASNEASRPSLGARLQLAPSIQPAAAARAPASPATPPSITLNIFGAAGQDIRALAKAVMRELERAFGIKARSSYDGDR